MTILLGSFQDNPSGTESQFVFPRGFDSVNACRVANVGSVVAVIKNMVSSGQGEQYLLAGQQMVYQIDNVSAQPSAYLLGGGTAGATLLVEWSDDPTVDFIGTYPTNVGSAGDGGGGTFVPIGSPVGYTTAQVQNPFADDGVMMTVAVIADPDDNAMFFAVQTLGNAFPSVEAFNDPSNGWYFGDGSFDPANASPPYFLGPEFGAGLFFISAPNGLAATAINLTDAGVSVAEGGTGPKQGVATLTTGTVTVDNTSVTATSRIFLTAQDANTTGALHIDNLVPGVSFDIVSSVALDSGSVAYEVFEIAI